MYKVALFCELVFKVVVLLCPLICIEGLIKEGFKTTIEKLLVVFLVIIFGIFLYFIL